MGNDTKRSWFDKACESTHKERKSKFQHKTAFYLIKAAKNSLSRVRPHPTMVPVPPVNRLLRCARVGSVMGWIEAENVRRRRRNLMEDLKFNSMSMFMRWLRSNGLRIFLCVLTWCQYRWAAFACCSADVVDNRVHQHFVAAELVRKCYELRRALPIAANRPCSERPF